MKLLYTPRHKLLDGLVSITSQKLGFANYSGAANYDKFIKQMVFEKYFAGIIFNGDWEDATEYPRIFNFSLVFPLELRSGVHFNEMSWETNILIFPELSQRPRNGAEDDGGTPVGYYREGFIPIQHTLTMTYIETLLKARSNGSADYPHIPKVFFQRLAVPSYDYDFLLRKVENIYALITIVSVILPITQMVLVRTATPSNCHLLKCMQYAKLYICLPCP